MNKIFRYMNIFCKFEMMFPRYFVFASRNLFPNTNELESANILFRFFSPLDPKFRRTSHIVANILKSRSCIFATFQEKQTLNFSSESTLLICLRHLHRGSEYDRKCYPITSSVFHSTDQCADLQSDKISVQSAIFVLFRLF